MHFKCRNSGPSLISRQSERRLFSSFSFFFLSINSTRNPPLAFHLLIKVHHIFQTVKMHNDTLICELLLLLCNCATLMLQACVEHVSMQATGQYVYTNISIASVMSIFQELHLLAGIHEAQINNNLFIFCIINVHQFCSIHFTEKFALVRRNPS